jgi:hypothetical protein
MDDLQGAKAEGEASGGNRGESTTRKMIEPSEYYDLAVSHRKLFRCDDAGTGTCGFLDPSTRELFVVRESKLLAYKRAGVYGP